MKKTVSCILLAMLLTSMFLLAFNIEPISAQSGGTIYINPNGTISSPVPANITTYDNVTYTFTGNNYLPIVVERSNIIINGRGYTLQASGEIGFNLTSVSNVTIRNTNIKNSFGGIYLLYSTGNLLSSNNIAANANEGIELDYSSNNTIYENNITNDMFGIYFYSSSENTISGNDITNNGYGVVLVSSSNNVVSESSITANIEDGIYLYSSSENTILENNIAATIDFGMWLESSVSNTVSGNNITNNGNSVHPMIWFPSPEMNWGGIVLDSSSSNIISGNNIMNNFFGISLNSSSGNTFSINSITNNYYSIWLGYSSNNRFYHNNEVFNSSIFFYSEVRDTTPSYSNIWDDGYPSGGNYWSNYNGTDLYSGPYQNLTGSDGIGDTPYVINANNTDHYPLMHPYGSIVNINKSQTYLTIQGAINNASAGDTILVKPGTYYGSVVVNKTVSLVGESRDSTILNGTSPDQSVVVEAANVEISDFTFTGWLGDIWINATANVTVINNRIVFSVIGIYVENSRNATVENNILSGTLLNTQGILLDNSMECTLINNTITGALYEGVRLWHSNNNIIRNNNITNNDGDGIFFYQSNQNNLSGNTISKNAGFAIDFEGGSSNNSIVHNNFIDNLLPQIYFVGNNPPNAWDDGYPSGGNYWSDYQTRYPNATEIDGSGIWNTPYVIDANNTDYYPLMEPYSLALSVSTSPASATLVVGQSKLFTSDVTGERPPYYYQWYLNGTPVSGATYSTWDFSEPVGSYTVYLNVIDNVGVTAKSNIASVTVEPLVFAVGITASAPSKTIIGQGFSLNETATVTNLGDFTETFNVTPYANTTSIARQTVTLTIGNSTTISFTWNTTGFAYGTYTIRTNVTFAQNGKNNWTGLFTYGTVKVTIPGDINGDGVVDSSDLYIFGLNWGLSGSQILNPNADIGGYGTIGAADLYIFGLNWGQSITL